MAVRQVTDQSYGGYPIQYQPWAHLLERRFVITVKTRLLILSIWGTRYYQAIVNSKYKFTSTTLIRTALEK